MAGGKTTLPVKKKFVRAKPPMETGWNAKPPKRKIGDATSPVIRPGDGYNGGIVKPPMRKPPKMQPVTGKPGLGDNISTMPIKDKPKYRSLPVDNIITPVKGKRVPMGSGNTIKALRGSAIALKPGQKKTGTGTGMGTFKMKRGS